jgi:ubiquinone/menaquinone biosynthesis C-methylase UbiE
MVMQTQAPRSRIYDEYAAVYDRSGQTHFSIMAQMYLREILRRHPVSGNRMLDVACGTGTLMMLQAEEGWEVTGLDRSPAMLAQARRKLEAAEVVATFVEADMCCFSLPEPVDLVTCFYDSLNYLLTPEELLHCFVCVYRALVPGGLFCFDLATQFFLRHYWQGIETYDEDNYSQVMESSFDEATGLSTLVLQGMVKNDGTVLRQFQEVHVEQAYAPEVVDGLLRAAGLVPEGLYDCFTHQEPNAASLRHFWVARRPV